MGGIYRVISFGAVAPNHSTQPFRHSREKRGKATVGDKTMLDSLVPAVEAFDKEIKGHMTVAQALHAAAIAAEGGMQATINMKAKYGRASWRQEGSVGVRDAGATAVYYLIRSFAERAVLTLGLEGSSPN